MMIQTTKTDTYFSSLTNEEKMYTIMTSSYSISIPQNYYFSGMTSYFYSNYFLSLSYSYYSLGLSFKVCLFFILRAVSYIILGLPLIRLQKQSVTNSYLYLITVNTISSRIRKLMLSGLFSLMPPKLLTNPKNTPNVTLFKQYSPPILYAYNLSNE